MKRKIFSILMIAVMVMPFLVACSFLNEDETAYEEGYDAGLEIGYNEGYDKGFDEGYDEGYDDGNGEGKSFTVNYIIDGSVYYTLTVNHDENDGETVSFDFPEDPNRDGYDFLGWFWDKDTWEKPFNADFLFYAAVSGEAAVHARFELKTGIVINQIYGIGNQSNDDQAGSNSFIELYNTAETDVSLDGFSVQTSNGGTVWQKLDLTGNIPAKHSFLIVLTRFNNTATPKLVITDYDMGWSAYLPNKNLKVALIRNTKLLTVANPFDCDGQGGQVAGYTDMIGVAGNGASDTIDGYETAFLKEQSKQKSIRRIDFTDTDNNKTDCAVIDYREASNLLYRPRSILDGEWTSVYDDDDAEFTSLPVMTIEIENGIQLIDVNREEYVNTTISLSNTKQRYLLDNVTAEFKGRGNGSWNQDKKGYRIKFTAKQSLLGNAASKHWALVPGQSDNTMLRNGTAYTVVNDALDNIEYTTSVQWVELYVNSQYCGVYSLFEHIRVDSDRVNIESVYGVENTGYLIEYDAYATDGNTTEGIDYFKIHGLRYPFTVKSPDPEDYTAEGITKEQYQAQVAYIKNYVQQVVDAILNDDYETFKALADVDSFLDMYLVHELFKNTDTGWSSFYMYKKPNGKIFAGPAWDFDLSAGLSRGDSSPEGIYVGGSVLQHSDYTSSEIYLKLMKNSNFINSVKIRWKEVSASVKTAVQQTVNRARKYEESFQREMNLWAGGQKWTNNVNYLENWLLNRINWLNGEWAV